MAAFPLNLEIKASGGSHSKAAKSQREQKKSSDHGGPVTTCYQIKETITGYDVLFSGLWTFISSRNRRLNKYNGYLQPCIVLSCIREQGPVPEFVFPQTSII